MLTVLIPGLIMGFGLMYLSSTMEDGGVKSAVSGIGTIFLIALGAYSITNFIISGDASSVGSYLGSFAVEKWTEINTESPFLTKGIQVSAIVLIVAVFFGITLSFIRGSRRF